MPKHSELFVKAEKVFLELVHQVVHQVEEVPIELVHQVKQVLLELVHQVEEVLLLPPLLVVLVLLPQVTGVLSYNIPGRRGYIGTVLRSQSL